MADTPSDSCRPVWAFSGEMLTAIKEELESVMF